MSVAKRCSWSIVVVTNQAGIGKDLISHNEVDLFNYEMQKHFLTHGLAIDGFYVCPHHPEAIVSEYRKNCLDRKPMPGLLLRAPDALNIDIARSVMIGDKETDIINLPGLASFLVSGRYKISNDFINRVVPVDQLCDSFSTYVIH
jgi:histidinol-phosphate phosphatase family protein